MLRVGDDGVVTPCPTDLAPPWACPNGLRGSAGMLELSGGRGWLALVHEVWDRPEQRVYRHRWLWWPEPAQCVVSPPFYFCQREGIEMALGLVEGGLAGNDPDRVCVSLGIEDESAWVLEYAWDALRTFLLEHHQRC